jgi:hypothetical protein
MVSFDFDGTLGHKQDVKDYAKILVKIGVDVWVVTSRYDELHKHLWPNNPTNDDLWAVIDEVGIKRENVKFMNFEGKADFLRDTFVLWHLDDDDVELENFRTINTKGINVNCTDWKMICEKVFSDNK